MISCVQDSAAVFVQLTIHCSNGGEGKLPSVRRKLNVDRMKVTWQTTASEDSTVVRGHRQGHRRGQRRQQWTIKPEQIILQAPFKR